jgi:hypothetical protein
MRITMATRPLRITLALAVVLSLLPLSAEATLAESKTFDDKVENATAIVHGRLLAKESRWDNARRWILTYNRFQIDKSYKGLPARELTIVTPGGTVGNMTQDAVGIPKFEVGGEHVLFVRNTQAGPTVLYFEQGAYNVVADQRGDKMVVPTVSSAVLIDTQAGKAVAPESPRSLREFEGLVRDTVKRREAVRMELIEKRKKEETSVWNVIKRNRALVLLAVFGTVLATIQLIRRR